MVTQDSYVNMARESMLMDDKVVQRGNIPPVVLAMARGLLIVLVPVLLVLGSVRVVMSPVFLQLEYPRAGFPVDLYGFSTEDRLQYAPFAMDYLLNDAEIDYLADLTFPNGSPLYTDRELQHMVDVKIVTHAAYQVLTWGGVVFLALSAWLWWMQGRIFWQTLRVGGIVTLAFVVGIILCAVVAWDFFFTTFHQLFFAEGTWRFFYSDTLIRLFPEQFWFDAALTIGILTITGALFAVGIASYRLKHNR